MEDSEHSIRDQHSENKKHKAKGKFVFIKRLVILLLQLYMII